MSENTKEYVSKAIIVPEIRHKHNDYLGGPFQTDLLSFYQRYLKIIRVCSQILGVGTALATASLLVEHAVHFYHLKKVRAITL